MADVIETVVLPGREALAPLVFLHEGLGCVELWRSFPHRLAAATARRALLYSRAGYGRSSPAPLPRSVRYMHDEALDVLPAVLDDARIDRPVLVGHSDGASIALIHAAGSGRPVAGLVLLAPHVFVEEHSLAGIRDARRAYVEGDLRTRLARYHADVDNTFWGWNDIWLSEQFRDWNIEPLLGDISAPALVLQCAEDPYGTPEQVDRIVAGTGGAVETEILSPCGHAPHLEQPDPAHEAITAWLTKHVDP